MDEKYGKKWAVDIPTSKSDQVCRPFIENIMRDDVHRCAWRDTVQGTNMDNR